MKLFISPHNDDECLFGAFTLLREKPLVVVVFDSYVQPARGIPGTDAEARRNETRAACQILGVECEFLGYRDDADEFELTRIQKCIIEDICGRCPSDIWFPAYEENGHAHHNLVAAACSHVAQKYPVRVGGQFLTYTRTRGKSTNGRKVPYEPEWVGLKFKALSCYQSQFQAATGCVEHFIARSLEEYVL